MGWNLRKLVASIDVVVVVKAYDLHLILRLNGTEHGQGSEKNNLTGGNEWTRMKWR